MAVTDEAPLHKLPSRQPLWPHNCCSFAAARPLPAWNAQPQTTPIIQTMMLLRPPPWHPHEALSHFLITYLRCRQNISQLEFASCNCTSDA
ncbi:hypothetical protein E2C01_004787 [Portunus trituberculatus]|uniref:Uncharacterized protein n=1 Tax=Portunus trituberculatus TaxID=210409 RepID=A0A5B7CRG6_PORTR|nr:hypothetical protein [Portunus trituberculatus]